MFEAIAIVEKRYRNLTDTFVKNSASEKISPVILDLLKKEEAVKRMQAVRADYLYKKREAEYYKKHGTAGEF